MMATETMAAAQLHVGAPIFAIDPSTSCGWSRVSPDHPEPTVGVERFKDGEFGDRANDFRKWLVRKLAHFRIAVVAIEQPIPAPMKMSNMDSECWALGIQFCVAEVCASLNIQRVPVPIQTWRSHFIGHPRAPKSVKGDTSRWLKDQAVRRCRELGWSPPNHDAAEALGILHFTACRLYPANGTSSTPMFAGMH